jgi:hypothetical protein
MRFLGGFVSLGGVFQVLLGGLLGVFGACGVRSRLLEMADFSAEATASALQKRFTPSSCISRKLPLPHSKGDYTIILRSTIGRMPPWR